MAAIESRCRESAGILTILTIHLPSRNFLHLCRDC